MTLQELQKNPLYSTIIELLNRYGQIDDYVVLQQDADGLYIERAFTDTPIEKPRELYDYIAKKVERGDFKIGNVYHLYEKTCGGHCKVGEGTCPGHTRYDCSCYCLDRFEIMDLKFTFNVEQIDSMIGGEVSRIPSIT